MNIHELHEYYRYQAENEHTYITYIHTHAQWVAISPSQHLKYWFSTNLLKIIGIALLFPLLSHVKGFFSF